MDKILNLSNDVVLAIAGVDFLKAIGTLSRGWGQLQITDAQSLAEILANGTDRLRDEGVRTAARAAGLEGAYNEIMSVLDSVNTFAGADTSRAILRLLSRVDRFTDDATENADSDPGLVKWSPPALAVAGGDDDLSFEGGASATLALEAGDLWPYRSDLASDPGLNGLVRIEVDADAHAGAKGRLPLQYVSLGSGVAATAKTRLAWYVTPTAPSQLFGEAIVAAVPGLPLPTRFDTLWKAVQTSNLKGAIFAIDGKIVFDGEISLATDGAITGVGGIGAAVTVKAQIIRASAFQLSARAIGKPGVGVGLPRPVVISVTSAKSRQSTLGFDFSVKLDATDLREKTSKIVRNVIKQWDDALQPLEKYLSPGTLLRDEMKAQLDSGITTITSNAGLKAALQTEARRVLGLEPGDADLNSWLSGLIIDAVSAEADKVHEGADAAIASIVARIPIAGLQGQAAAPLKAEIKKLLGAFDNQLKAAVGNIVTPAATSLAAMLAQIGVSIDGAVTTLDAKLAAVRKLLQRFNALLAKIAAETEKAANYRLQISFATETVTREWSEFLFTGTFSQNTPAIRTLFDSLVAGRVDRVAELLQGGNNVPGLIVDTERSYALRGKSWSQSTSFGLFIIGFEIGSQQLLTAEAEVKATADGILVTGKAAAAQIDKRPDGTQIVQLTSPYSLAAGTGSDPREPVMALAIGVNRFEKDLKEGELADFLSRLVEFGLLPASVPAQAQAVLRRWQPIGGGNSNVPGRVEVGFALDSRAMARLYRRAERVNRDLPPAVRVDIANQCIAALIRAGVVSQQRITNGLSLARALVSGAPENVSDAELALYIANYWPEWDGPKPGESAILTSAWSELVEHFGGKDLEGRPRKGKLQPILNAIDALGDLALASPLPPDNWQREDYLKATRRVSEGLAPWLAGNKKLFKLDDKVGRQLIAFMLLIRSLARLPVGSPQGVATDALPAAPLYIVLSRGPKGDEERTVIV